MLQGGILNPAVNHLLARIRHTNTLVIADWAFPSWQGVETIDLSLTQGIPLITDLLSLLHSNFKVGEIWQAEEFLSTNPPDTTARFQSAYEGFRILSPNLQVKYFPHLDFKKLVPSATGLIRTGDTAAYGNLILQSV